MSAERFMLMKHTKDCWIVTIWSDGVLRIESKYKRRVNQVHVLHYSTVDFEWMIESLPKYVYDMVTGVMCDYLDYKGALDETI